MPMDSAYAKGERAWVGACSPSSKEGAKESIVIQAQRLEKKAIPIILDSGGWDRSFARLNPTDLAGKRGGVEYWGTTRGQSGKAESFTSLAQRLKRGRRNFSCL